MTITSSLLGSTKKRLVCEVSQKPWKAHTRLEECSKCLKILYDNFNVLALGKRWITELKKAGLSLTYYHSDSII